MQQGVQVKPGDRIVIHGLKGRPELNGQQAVLVGPAANGRINVRLDSGAEVALKQENLGIAAPGGGGAAGGGMPGAGGGMPGFGGGMPGFGGGMPGGMPGMPGGMPDLGAMAEQCAAALRQRLSAAGINLPPGVSASQVGIGVLVAVFALSRVLSMTVLALVGMVAYWGLFTDGGSSALARGSGKVGAVLGRRLPPWVALGALCLGAALLGHTVLPGSRARAAAGQPASGDSSFAQAVSEAYEQGYTDGIAGLDKRPPKHIPMPGPAEGTGRSSSGSGGFGLGSLMKYGLAGQTVYSLGRTPSGWDPRLALANARANPMQAVMIFMLFSGFLF